MTRRNAILHFDTALVDKPIISGMIRDHQVVVNILQASITPEKAGTMFVQIDGRAENVSGAIDFLRRTGVRLVFPAKSLIWDEDKCTHCGACICHCLPGALSVSPVSGHLAFEHDNCLACELCIPACPFGALESVGEHLSAGA